MGFIEKQKECNSKKRIVFLHSGECNSKILLHSWEIELSIRHHVTKINQLNDLNLTRYYININICTHKWASEISIKNIVICRLALCQSLLQYVPEEESDI